MTRTEYLKELNHYLKKLPAKDYAEAMDYFNEYFDEAGEENEEAVIAELGTPKQAAHDLITNLLDKEWTNDTEKTSIKKVLLLSFLALMAAPIAFPLLIIILAVLFSVFVGLMASVMAAVITGISFIFFSGVSLMETINSLSFSFETIMFGLGLSLGFLGLGMLIMLITFSLAKLLGLLIYKAIRLLTKGR